MRARLRARRWRWRRRPRSLQRQLFVWLALTIVVTGLALALVFRVAQTSSPAFPGGIEPVERFIADRYADVWNDRARLHSLSESLSRALNVDLRVEDASGLTLDAIGRCERPTRSIEVLRNSSRLGSVHGCFHTGFRPLVGLGAVLVATLVLWVAAARLASALTRPISSLIAVTREIGAGSLQSRVRLGRHSRGELGTLAEAINDMAERIERQLREQRELLAIVSHEVRSPLARLRVSSEILRADAGNEAALSAIDREVSEIDDLVGKLLVSSRLDFGTITRTALDTVAFARSVLQRRGLPLSLLQDDSRGLRCSGDATLIARALENVLDNAERHGAGVSALCLRAARPGEHASPEQALVFEVSDAGPGFDPRTLSRVFDAFYSAGSIREERHASLGLGLSLVRRTAQAHGGRAWAENLAGGGARVSFSVG